VRDFEDCERLQMVALRSAILSCILFAVAPIGFLAQTATIHVRVLDGRTGKKLSGMNLAFVDYHTDPDGSTHDDLNGRMTVKTSVDGDSYTANPAFMEVWYLMRWVMESGRRVLGKGSTIAIRGHMETNISIPFLQSLLSA
jgi:hypothetical protein